MVRQASRATAAAALLVGLCLAQGEPGTPSFRAHTDLVTVPFQVRRGSRPVFDLKPSDVVLLEDGVPRGFTIFEAPPVHVTLDLVLMFDVTKPPSDQKTRKGWFWDAKALQDLESYWSETIARRLLDEPGAEIRFSIYRFDQSGLQRLCQSAGDPKVLLDALRRLSDSVPAGRVPGQGADVPLPAGLAIRDRERKARQHGAAPQPWSLAGALGALRDSASPGPGKETAARALVVFSTGAEGTSVTPRNLADQAVTAGVPVYPVALFAYPPILPYDGYGLDGLIYYDEAYTGRSMFGPAGPYTPMFGPADRPTLPPGYPPVARYINYPFEELGDLTGAHHFESVNHSTPLGESGERFVLSSRSFSMTGGEILDILKKVKNHALARFSSNYNVGFAPSATGAPREHQLEVRLTSKSVGKVTDGKRSATY